MKKSVVEWKEMTCQECGEIFECFNENCFHSVDTCFCDLCSKKMSSKVVCEYRDPKVKVQFT